MSAETNRSIDIEVKPGQDFSAGPYLATGTVASDRINLFDTTPNTGYHIGTLVSGSRTKIERFEKDAARICAGLALLDDPKVAAASDVLALLKTAADADSPNEDVRTAWWEARAAVLAKATGEQS